MVMVLVKDFSLQDEVQLQLALTVDKLGLKAFKSCRLAKSENSPRFAFNHSWVPVIDETQPGSAQKEQNSLAG